jgi:ribosomal protein L11 methyltransferase
MISLSLECREAESEFLSAELWEQGASGIQEEDLPGGRVRLRAWFDSNAGLIARFSSFMPLVRDEEPVDWEEVTRQAWQPVEVGSRFYLAPEWDESETPVGRMRLTVHPGMALGTGDHPATRLALAAMECHLRAGDRVLDVGTGTGILLAGAHLLGAKGAGCDIDYESARTARHNLIQDAHPPRVFAGSLRAVAPGSADVVVANINAATHQTLAPEYARVARRLIILAGFPDRHEAGVEQALWAQGWHPAGRLTDREWVCLTLSRATDSPVY